MPEANAVDDRPRTLHQALVKFQADAPKITKDAKAKVPTKGGGEFTYDYVTLTHLSEEVLPVLASLGLTWITKPSIADGRPALSYELAFEDPQPVFEVGADEVVRRTEREVIEGTMPLMVTSGGPQDLGGAITYMRRYALCAVLGLAPDTDDDAGSSQQGQVRPKKATKAAAKAVAERAEKLGVLDKVQLAASHFGEDIGSCESIAQATSAVQKLNMAQVEKMNVWLTKKEQEALDG